MIESFESADYSRTVERERVPSTIHELHAFRDEVARIERLKAAAQAAGEDWEPITVRLLLAERVQERKVI